MRTSEEIVQDLPWRWSVQGRIVIVGWLGYMFDAWDVVLNGYLTPLLGLAFQLAPGQGGWIATANLIGMAVGAVVWGTIADRIGRKKAFALTILVFSLFSALGALAPGYAIFLVCRFIAGFGLGGCVPVDYAMVSEFSPARHRGKVVATMGLWWPIGATLAGVSSTLLLPLPANWRWMLALMVLPSLLLFWVRRGVPESPLFAARMGDELAARAIVDDLVRRTGAAEQPYRIATRVPARTMRPGRPCPAPGRAALHQLRRVWSFNPAVTSAAWLLTITILMIYYAALSWMPSILRAEGYGDQAAFASTTVMTFVGIFGVLVSIVLVDLVGRRLLIAVSAPLAAVALTAFAVWVRADSATVLLALFGFAIQVSVPILYTYVSEMYPTDLRASGFGWASSAGRTATGLSPILFGAVLWPHLGLPLTFGLLALAMTGAVVWMFRAVPETAGKPLDHITQDHTAPIGFGAVSTEQLDTTGGQR